MSDEAELLTLADADALLTECAVGLDYVKHKLDEVRTIIEALKKG